jgi:type I restriction enzyme, R subunit
MTRRGIEGWVEEACLEYLEDVGWRVAYGPDLLADGITPERVNYSQVVLTGRLEAAIARLNPQFPAGTRSEVINLVTRTQHPGFAAENLRLHEALVEGVQIEHRDEATGGIAYSHVRLIDWDDPTRNDFLAVNQFTVVEGGNNRRPDIVLFINGLPIAVIELKNPGDENATLRGAFNQLQTYRAEIPSLFRTNVINVVSDGVEARMGSTTAAWEHFAPWKTIEGLRDAPTGMPQLEVLVRGAFDRTHLLDLIQNFVAFSDEDSGLVKRVAKYHQFWAVRAAVESTVKAATIGEGRAGVVWHTQGSGKSLEMLFYASKVMRHPAMANPTLVLLTDRNDLDDQLFDEVFSPARNLPEAPVQAQDRADLQRLLRRASGGIVFTTVQKFFPKVPRGQSTRGIRYPTLSERRNIVVIADEAHRSQYDFIDGFARHIRDALPNASFIGFTGTPIESTDKSTRQVFGDYVSVYDITQAVEDGATVRIYYEARLAQIALDEQERPRLDEDFDEVTETEEEGTRQRLKSKWARLEALVGSDKRLALVAKDLVEHWEARRDVLEGKAMVVGMSRRICARLYEEIVKLRPEWHSNDDAEGVVKVIITGSAADDALLQPHIRNKRRLRALKARAKDPDDPLELVIVRDMWLTGFDSPSMHTMYVDKPMRGASLMQAIARINRTFRDKPGGLVVDYLGLAENLRRALADYSDRSRQDVGIDISQVVGIVVEKDEVLTSILHGHNWSAALTGGPRDYVAALASTVDFVLGDNQRKTRFLSQSLAMVKAFALSVPEPAALSLRDRVGFFQDVRSQIRKLDIAGAREPNGQSSEELDTAIGQILSRAVASEGVVDIYEAAGLAKPELSILSNEFLEDVRRLPYKNLQFEVLRKLLNDDVRDLERRNLVQGRRFSEMLTDSILRYQNRSLTSAEVISELVELAKSLQVEHERGRSLGLSDAELAFYDAIRQNGAAVVEMGDELLKQIAIEVVDVVKRNATIDWSIKEQVRAKLRSTVKRVLLNYDYPPDQAETATLLVLQQAELLAAELTDEHESGRRRKNLLGVGAPVRTSQLDEDDLRELREEMGRAIGGDP